MAAPHSPPQIDLSGPALLLGVPGHVCLLDCRGFTPDQAAERVTLAIGHGPVGVRVTDSGVVPAALGAGASLVHVASTAATDRQVGLAARSGAVVVLSGDADACQGAALGLLEAGGQPGRVVVELAFTYDGGALDVDQVRFAGTGGLVVGAVLRPGTGPVEEVMGWEIAMLTQLLGLGVRTIRNVSAYRFQRVLAVVDALAEAAACAGTDTGDAARSSGGAP